MFFLIHTFVFFYFIKKIQKFERAHIFTSEPPNFFFLLRYFIIICISNRLQNLWSIMHLYIYFNEKMLEICKRWKRSHVVWWINGWTDMVDVCHWRCHELYSSQCVWCSVYSLFSKYKQKCDLIDMNA